MLGRRGKRYIFLFAFLLWLPGYSQEVQIKGGFIEDEMMLGESVSFWMTATYPPHMEMVLPDSTFDFLPFEFASRRYFETQLIDEMAFDSAVYQLQSYEIEPIQHLFLPAVILKGQDSIVYETPTDSIAFIELAPVVTDTTKLQANVNYQTVSRQFNYPLLYYISGGLAVVSLIFLIIFGKRIMRYFKLRKLKKEYEKFSGTLATYIEKLKSNPEPELAEEALTLWKSYQQKLDSEPFPSYTTRDILLLPFTQELEKPLKSIDKTIYSGQPEETIFQDFQQIEGFTQHRYSKKVAEIHDGK